MRRLIYLALVLMLVCGGTLFAQTYEYSFASAVGTFTPITGGTLLGTETSDDQRYVDPATPIGGTTTTGPGFPIGFNFMFNGLSFDRLAINNNGWISLGQSALTPSVNNSSTSGYTPIQSIVAITPDQLYSRISALGRDLQAQTGATLRLETIGTAPNQVCVIQWLGYKKYGATGTGDNFSFQIRLYEGTNKVETVYGVMTSNATAGNFQVGLRGALVTDFFSRTTSTDWNATTTSALNTEFCVMSNVIFPANGLTFSFNYPQMNVAPNPANLVSPANGATLVSPFATVNWASGGGFPTGYRINFGSNNPPTNIANNVDMLAVNSYDPPGELANSTTYYWQVVPYNAIGPAVNCPVWSFTTHGDASITTLPYSQSWDLVTPPALPFDWTSIYQATVTTGYVKTVTTTPQSTPNCVAIYNPTDVNTIAMLIGPQLGTDIPANSVRVKFWGKGSAAYHLIVGVMTNPTDPATFVSIQDVNVVANWNQYIVSLAGYTDAGRYIAFKHASTAAGQTIYVDEVTFELIAPNDLAAVSVTGNATPSVGVSTNYTVSVYNWGTATQTAYSVKLMSGDTELASVAGPSIAPAATQTVVLPWTPSVQGPASIYGKVVLAGDANPANDQSPLLNVTVMPAGAVVVTIGEGNLVEGIPLDFYYKNSLHQALYFENEIGVYGSITALTFYNNFVSDLTSMPVKFWLGTTNLPDLSGGWILPDQLTLVYDGTVNLPTGINSIVIPLQTPYMYTGGNLVLYANRPIDTVYYNSNDNFATQTIGTNRGRKLVSDSVTYDPAAPSAAGTLSGNFAKTSLTFVVDNMGSLSGTVSSGANPVAGALVQIVGTTYSQLSNATGGYNFPFVLTGNYTVTASKLGYESLTLPATIVNDQNTVLNFNLPASTTVSVSGLVVGSDAPTVGLAGAAVHLDGPIDFDGTTNATGNFTITGVLSGNTYTYTIVKVGYSDLTGSITVGAGNYNMGTVVMNEVSLPPVHVLATENTPQTQVMLTWRPPGSTGGGGVEDFELDDGDWVPSSNWTNPLGDFEWTDSYDVANWAPTYTGTSVVPPPTAHSGTGLWGSKITTNYTNAGGFSYLSKTFNLAGITNAQLRFWSWENLFGNFDYAQVTINGTLVWGPSWDYSATQWRERIIDLSAYDGMAEVVIRFEMWATTTVNYAGWYIDDVYVGAAQTIARNQPARQMPDLMRGLSEPDAAKLAETLAQNNPNRRSHNLAISARDPQTRVLNGYKVWRLLQGNEANEATWSLLTTNTITDTTYTDTAWAAMPDGNYRWAVKGIYTNSVQGPAAFSNMIRILRNDLSALSLTGTTTPTSGAATEYTVEIKNTGTVAKTAGSYTVKLMNGTTELASVPGPAIAPAEELNVLVPWTPATAGPLALTGKVVLPADTVPANDISPVLNITVMPAGVIAITVGDGSQTEGRPVDFYYKNSLFQCLYFPSEIGMFGSITALSFYNTFITDLPNKPTKIWLGTTDLNDLSGGWILPPQLTLVYDGNISYPAGVNTVTIPLQTPFPYLSGNLVLYANRPWEDVLYNTNDNFYTQTIGTNRARKLTSSTVTYDPAAPSAAGTMSGAFPKTTFHLSVINPTPVYSINPASKNWGTVLINSSNDQSFNIYNAGGGTLSVSSITISGSPMFSLQNLPPLPANISFGQFATFVARYNPTAVGAHTATITITDNMARSYSFNLSSNDANRMPHNVVLSGNCIDTTLHTLPYAQNFDAVTIPDLPPDWSHIYQATVTTGYVKTVTATPHSPPNSVAMYNPTDANTIAMLIAPPLGTTIPTNTTRVKFWGRSSGANYPLSVGIMVNNNDPLTYTETEIIALTTTWTEYVVAFNAYTGNGKHIVFKHGLGGTARTLYVDDVMIEVIPTNDLAALSITGNATPTMGLQETYNIAVKNWGTASQSTYTVKMYNTAGNELATAAGVTCAPGATVTVPVTWTPAAEGAITVYGKVILDGDQNNLNDQSPNLNLLVNPTGVYSITVGAGGQFARVPLDFYYKNSIYQGLYYPSEMGDFLGQINALQFYNNFVTDLQAKPTKVWIGTTTQTSLTDGWIPTANLTLVFDGTINYPAGDNIVTIPFTTPYLYLNGENLVIMCNRPMDTAYFNTSDDFQAQTDAVNTTRSRKISSDSTEYDPNALPTTGTVSGQFPKTTFIVIPGGVGHLNGTVLGAGNLPLEGVQVVVGTNAHLATTNAQGQYNIQNILPNTYPVSFTKYGYITLETTVTIEEDETDTLNVTMQPMPTVSVTGSIFASDTGAGLAGASISLTGYQNYSANTIGTGAFTIPAVYANQSYAYTILCPGYSSTAGTINVGATNHSMGNITLNEIAYAPFGVQASLSDDNSTVNLVWQAPDPTAVEVTEGFESATFPPTGWTQVITNTGAQVIPGVFPTWCRFGAISAGGTPVTPPQGDYQAGLWWDYAHQDEWLITPAFNCPPSAHLSLAAYTYRGSAYDDHYYIKISTDNGSNWTVLWDATALTGGWNYYAYPLVVNMEMYGGQQIKLAFHAEDPPSDDGLWYAWFIDDIYIGNATESVRFAGSDLVSSSKNVSRQISAPLISAASISISRANEPNLQYGRDLPSATALRSSSRSLQGYKVWRLQAGTENNPNTWVQLTTQTISTLTFGDQNWNALPNGSYRWAVKALYTANVASVPSFSNILVKETLMGNIVGFVRKSNNQPIAGAVVSTGGQTATTNSAGAYSLPLPVGTYSVTATADTYLPRTIEGVTVSANQNTTLNFILTSVSNEDPVTPITATALTGNYPNPFNPETLITYAIKDKCTVSLDIYNLKGQIVRSLVKREENPGNYSVLFDGRDNNGQALSSGIYLYRLNAGSYSSTRKMMLME